MKEEKFHYPIRSIRVSDEEWDKFKKRKEESNKSWNLFIRDNNKQYEV